MLFHKNMTDNNSVAFLITGNEILRVDKQEKNLQYLATSLATVGLKITKAEIVPDDVEEIDKKSEKIIFRTFNSFYLWCYWPCP